MTEEELKKQVEMHIAGLNLIYCSSDAKVMQRIWDERNRYKQLCDANFDKTADGKYVVECENLYCPRCAGELKYRMDRGICDVCHNEDSEDRFESKYWFVEDCYSTAEAAKAAIAIKPR